MHPGLEHEKASELTEEQIMQKIVEINKRIGAAHQTGRTEVIHQLQLLLEHYEGLRQDKLQQELQQMIDEDPKLGRKVIDIDWPDPAEENEEPKKNT